MIYRISIGKKEDGKWVRDHYATDEELHYLKIMPNGNVAQIFIGESLVMPLPNFHIIDVESEDGNDTFVVYGHWQDVSATHRVEWDDIDKSRIASLEAEVAKLEKALRIADDEYMNATAQYYNEPVPPPSNYERWLTEAE